MKRIRTLLLAFIVLLALSGISAFPLKSETRFLIHHLHWFPPFMKSWILQVHDAVWATPDVVLYGTDWLAFGHLVIAMFFIPVYAKPIQYQLNLKIGMLACLAVFPLAFACGPVRGIPFFHQLIDCAFGVVGFALLAYIHQLIKREERAA